MRIIFTANRSLFSRVVRWTFREPASHVALVFDNDLWLVQSNLLGMNIRIFEPFIQNHSIIDSLDYDLDLAHEEEIFQSVIRITAEQEYDWPGFIYFAWRGFLLRLFGLSLPEKNEFGRDRMNLCTEMVSYLPEWLTGISKGTDLGIMTPWKLRNLLRSKR